MDNIVIFDKAYPGEKTAEGIAISQAVTNGWCAVCQHLSSCESDPNFVFPKTAACMIRKREIIACWQSMQKE